MKKPIQKETVTARLKKSTVNKIDKIAEQNEESRSETIRKIIEKFFEVQI